MAHVAPKVYKSPQVSAAEQAQDEVLITSAKRKRGSQIPLPSRSSVQMC